MDYKQLLDSITPEIYQRFQKAIEIGKWPDGKSLTDEQKSSNPYTAPIFTDTGKNPFLFMSGLLEHHHLIAAGWALDLDESLGVVRDGVKPNGHGCTD